MTASMGWSTSAFDEEERSPNRWQHRLKREHPTCTERTIAHEECGWKGGDGTSVVSRKYVNKVARFSPRLSPPSLSRQTVDASAKRAASNGALGDQTKPAFHLIQPRGVGRGVVDMIVGCLLSLEPFSYRYLVKTTVTSTPVQSAMALPKNEPMWVDGLDRE